MLYYASVKQRADEKGVKSYLEAFWSTSSARYLLAITTIMSQSLTINVSGDITLRLSMSLLTPVGCCEDTLQMQLCLAQIIIRVRTIHLEMIFSSLIRRQKTIQIPFTRQLSRPRVLKCLLAFLRHFRQMANLRYVYHLIKRSLYPCMLGVSPKFISNSSTTGYCSDQQANLSSDLN